MLEVRWVLEPLCIKTFGFAAYWHHAKFPAKRTKTIDKNNMKTQLPGPSSSASPLIFNSQRRGFSYYVAVPPLHSTLCGAERAEKSQNAPDCNECAASQCWSIPGAGGMQALSPWRLCDIKTASIMAFGGYEWTTPLQKAKAPRQYHSNGEEITIF